MLQTITSMLPKRLHTLHIKWVMSRSLFSQNTVESDVGPNSCLHWRQDWLYFLLNFSLFYIATFKQKKVTGEISSCTSRKLTQPQALVMLPHWYVITIKIWSVWNSDVFPSPLGLLYPARCLQSHKIKTSHCTICIFLLLGTMYRMVCSNCTLMIHLESWTTTDAEMRADVESLCGDGKQHVKISHSVVAFMSTKNVFPVTARETRPTLNFSFSLEWYWVAIISQSQRFIVTGCNTSVAAIVKPLTL